MAEGWRRLHNGELHNFYTSSYSIRVIKSRSMEWVGHVAHMGGVRNEYKILSGKPEGKRSYRRPRCRWQWILWK
jgi:hypothetical protein